MKDGVNTISRNYNLESLMSVDSQIQNENAIFVNKTVSFAIGDLHANALKLIKFLFFTGIVHSKEQVQKDLISSYQTLNYDLFEENINKLFIHKLYAKQLKLIFIGDTLCDRGKSDYMIMFLYKFLAENGIHFTICLSNHDCEFIHQYCNNFQGNFDLRPVNSFDYPYLNDNRQNLIKTTYKQVYLPRLRVAEYTKINDTIIIYTHAPCDSQSLSMLRMSLKNMYFNNSDVISNIVEANKQLQETIKKNPFYLYKWIHDTGLFRFVWNRETNIKFRGNITNVFGHIGPMRVGLNQVNLDSLLGIDPEYNIDDLLIYKVNLSPSQSLKKQFEWFKSNSKELKNNFRQQIPIIEENLRIQKQLMLQNNLISFITTIKDSSSSWYSGFGHSNRKGIALNKILEFCREKSRNNEIIGENGVLEILKESIAIALVPRGETTDIQEIQDLGNYIKQTKTALKALQLIKENKFPELNKIISMRIKTYIDLLLFSQTEILDLYLNKENVYNKSIKS